MGSVTFLIFISAYILAVTAAKVPALGWVSILPLGCSLVGLVGAWHVWRTLPRKH